MVYSDKRVIIAMDRLPDPYCINEIVGTIIWCGRFEQFGNGDQRNISVKFNSQPV